MAALGNFDGVHRGHQDIIRHGARFGRPGAVVTFEPHPRDLLPARQTGVSPDAGTREARDSGADGLSEPLSVGSTVSSRR